MPDVETLLTTVNWSAFDVAPDLHSRLAVLHDTRVCPKGCGFVVAQAVEDIDQDGFAVIYPGTDIMMPTCHETPTPAPGSLPRGTMPVVMYDVVCYAVGARPRWRGGGREHVKHKTCASVDVKPALLRLHDIGGITALDASPARIRFNSGAPVYDSGGHVELGRLQLFGENVNTNVFVRGRGNFNPENPELQMEALMRGRKLPRLRMNPAYYPTEEEW